MKEWTFGRKVGSGFAIVLLLTFAMGVVAVLSLDGVVAAKDGTLQRMNDNLRQAMIVRVSMQTEVANVRGYLLTGHDRFREGVRSAGRTYTQAVRAMRSHASTDRRRELLRAVERAEAGHQTALEQVLEMRRSHEDPVEIMRLFDEQVLPRFDALQIAGDALFEDIASSLERERTDTNRVVESTKLLLGGMVLLVVLIALGVSIALTRTLSQHIGESVERVRSSSTALAATANQQASSAQEQATAVNEISTTVSELLVTSRQIMKSASRVSAIASQTAEGAERGEESVRSADAALTDIRAQMDMIVEHMLGLGQRSQEIGGILDIVNELSEQTNILAINATIEAAGAGEAGRRFAVVGEEVRRLSQRVSGSIREIRTLVEEIRASVNTTVMATETGSKTVDMGTKRFEQLNYSFRSIAELVEATTDASKEIELSTRQQASAVEQLNAAMSDVTQVTKENESASRDTLETASELASLSKRLVSLVRRREVRREQAA